MKLFKQVLPVIAVCSTIAFAQGVAAKSVAKDSQFENQMTQIEEVFDSQVYVATAEDFTSSSFVMDVEKEMGDIYVSKEQAEALGLTKTLSFNVYSVINQQQVSDTIAKMIHRDEPKYFSVELFENQIGKSDTVEYVAKVTEYE
ncbi:hypothetical protein VIN01S_24190 [Vibrio inusitatus NBRC 102082]|uniref:DUF3316 domain-containing protein n=1 Tax=Vibrio inusitatus NBRC 102082 TaxID=1219070 RepID=A0A4Y3HX49_9VIBR|nr:hypothetical protein [Vibrio inusitatus]GEA51615.1 hypothetical protein VIN01S_24190 [Vibrio inusitatus NBRC 102082]